MLRTLEPVLLKMPSSSLCLWSMNPIKTHKPGFLCKPLRITFRVTHMDDQYACVIPLQTSSQHAFCKFITSYSPGKKKLTYLKLTLFSQSFCEGEGGIWGWATAELISHAFVLCSLTLVTGTFFYTVHHTSKLNGSLFNQLVFLTSILHLLI